MTRKILKFVLGSAIALLASSLVAKAQTVTGAITGNVSDPSGAVIAGAHVTAHNQGTGVDSPTTTNGSGFYRLEFLPIGRYSVLIEAPGSSKRDHFATGLRMGRLRLPT